MVSPKSLSRCLLICSSRRSLHNCIMGCHNLGLLEYAKGQGIIIEKTHQKTTKGRGQAGTCSWTIWTQDCETPTIPTQVLLGTISIHFMFSSLAKDRQIFLSKKTYSFKIAIFFGCETKLGLRICPSGKTRAQVNWRVLNDEMSGKVAFWLDKVACAEMCFY